MKPLLAADKEASGTQDNTAQSAQKRWDNMTQEQKDQLRRRHREFNALPQEQQEILRKRYQRSLAMPPKQRQELRQQFRTFKKLPHTEQRAIRRTFAVTNTSVQSEAELRRTYQRLLQLRPQDRQRFLKTRSVATTHTGAKTAFEAPDAESLRLLDDG
ncbi:MAG: DUF3106 domain-containing protein [Myxococcota bacterium]